MGRLGSWDGGARRVRRAARLNASAAGAAAQLLDAVAARGLRPGDPLALVVAPGAVAIGVGTAALDVPAGAVPAAVAAVEVEFRPRWVWWSAAETLGPILAAPDPPRLRACWDLAAVHRLLAGGWQDDPSRVWAVARGLPTAGIPRPGQLDLLAGLDGLGGAAAGTGAGHRAGGDDNGPDDDGVPGEPVRPDGQLRPDWAGGAWRRLPGGARRWARLALVAQAGQARLLAALPTAGDSTLTARSESAAALIAVELGSVGLPVDRTAMTTLLERLIGPRPANDAAARQSRSERDNRVLSLAPASAADTDLRNPAQVRTMLGHAGLDVPDTRSWRLERSCDALAVVPALLAWRKAERIATTYGYDWLERHVAPDGRLRGAWTASDGGAGRMTAQTGLHNLPAEMRVAVAAEEGHLLVRADLGQVEPRVLAAVSGDAALAAAAREDDLYQPVALRIGCTRAVAKVAVLAAMYGQTSGAAGQALAGMKESYPVALRYLDAADSAGRHARDVRTYGGRLVRADPVPALAARAGDAARAAHRGAVAGRGRYVRNAVVQGAAAELFKAWAATVRSDLLDSGDGAVVLCLHDELLLHVRAAAADRVAARVVSALESTATRWFRGCVPVRFVSTIAVVPRWSEAKG